MNIEIVCSDVTEHRRRVESRTSDVEGHRSPTWQDVIGRDYREWDCPRLVVDAARLTVDESVRAIVSSLRDTSSR
jgi:hypothetical protein